MFRLIAIIAFLVLPALLIAQHPLTFFTAKEAALVKKDLLKYPLLQQSFLQLKNEVDPWLGKKVDVPLPKDPAGGYTHDKHKSNYMLMCNSGILFNLTGDKRYVQLVKDMLLQYAKLNPALKKHPQATSSSPGRIFWQALNDANWLVYAGMAYDLVYQSLSPTDRKTIEEGAFKPEVDFLTIELKDWFNRLHNHSVWAAAGVGIVGIASNNQHYVDMALYGTHKDRKSGFIAQMDFLFSPDGYYTEGPYYVRYAILPYIVFANALHNTQPALKIFEHRNRILQKALLTCLQQTNSNGMFFPMNDALKDKDYTTNELVTAINIAWKVYGSNEGLLTVAQKQNRVLMNKGGVDIAAALASGKKVSPYYPYMSMESTDGVKGEEGGVSILRNGKGEDLTSLVFKYTSQGFGHGHFDKLNINLFDKGNEIFTDYGSARFIGVEQKYGGRYLPENNSYAQQTIVHNTLVVDETSHFNGDGDLGQQFHSEKVFSDLRNPAVQVVVAKEENAYKNTQMQRSIYLLQLPGLNKMMVDIFNVNATEAHQYDLPFQYNGQFIQSSFKYKPSLKKMETLGAKNGYQFLWKEAEASLKDTLAQFTFLNGKTFYTLSALIQDSAQLFFTRSGASDPHFNIRREPAYIIRKFGKQQSFVNVLEIHGKYDPVNEFSTYAYPSVKQVQFNEDETYTIVKLLVEGKELLIIQTKKQLNNNTVQQLSVNNKMMSWKGTYAVFYDGNQIKNN